MLEKVSFSSSMPVFRKPEYTRKNLAELNTDHYYNMTSTYISSALACLAVIGMACLVAGNKNFKNIQHTAEKTVKNAEQAVSKQLSKSQGLKEEKLVQKVTPQVNKPMSEADTLKNIDTKHISSKERNIVDQIADETVTEEQQLEYNRSIAYRPMRPKQQRIAQQMHIKNKNERKRLNSIGAAQPEETIRKLYRLNPDTQPVPKTIKMEFQHPVIGIIHKSIA